MRYELAEKIVANIIDQLKDARWGLHDDAYREVLRAVKGRVFEEELKLGVIRVEDERS